MRFNDVNEALCSLAEFVMDGDEVGSRNGRVMERLGVQVQLDQPWNREILVPGRKASLPAQIAETMWVLAGRNDVDWLSAYLPRAKDFSDDGETWRGGYGPRIRWWDGMAQGVDGLFQVANLDQLEHVHQLLQKNPLDRRAVINIYDPVTDTMPGKDIPCNNWLHFLSRGGLLHMFVTVRSNDLIWGWSGINAFEWSALQEILAGMLGIGVGPLTFSISSLHVYDRHWAKADKIKELELWPNYKGVRFDPKAAEVRTVQDLDKLIQLWFTVEAKIRSGSDLAEEAIRRFPEPMLQDWLKVLHYHWGGEDLDMSARSSYALHIGPSPKRNKIKDLAKNLDMPEQVLSEPAPSLARYASKLHEEKHKAYGDSWKRRGEMLGVMANIARKIDRLGVSDDQETAADTAIDLLVYLVKYRLWLSEFANAPLPFGREWTLDGITDSTIPVSSSLKELGKHRRTRVRHTLETKLRKDFEGLEYAVTNQHDSRFTIVNHMMRDAYDLAAMLYWKQGNEKRRWNPEV